MIPRPSTASKISQLNLVVVTSLELRERHDCDSSVTASRDLTPPALLCFFQPPPPLSIVLSNGSFPGCSRALAWYPRHRCLPLRPCSGRRALAHCPGPIASVQMLAEQKRPAAALGWVLDGSRHHSGGGCRHRGGLTQGLRFVAPGPGS